jgi:hypothetical protein
MMLFIHCPRALWLCTGQVKPTLLYFLGSGPQQIMYMNVYHKILSHILPFLLFVHMRVYVCMCLCMHMCASHRD